MQFVLAVPAKLTKPEDAARWVRDVEFAYEAIAREESEPQRGVDQDAANEHDALFAMMHRWDDFSPTHAQYRHMLIGKLQVAGYQLAEPVARSGKSGSRTYMRVLRKDGVNAGFLNSTTFTYVRARAAVPPLSDLVKSKGRYPSTDINSEAAVDFVARVATAFRSLP